MVAVLSLIEASLLAENLHGCQPLTNCISRKVFQYFEWTDGNTYGSVQDTLNVTELEELEANHV